MVVEGDVAELHLTAAVLRIGHGDTLLGCRVVHFRATWLTFDLAIGRHAFAQAFAAVLDAFFVCIPFAIVQAMAIGFFGRRRCRCCDGGHTAAGAGG